MKKSFALVTLLVLSACARERTTKYYSTQGQPKAGEPVTYVLSNADYEKQQEEKKKQKLKRRTDALIKPSVKPDGNTDLITIQEDFDQEDLAILFNAYNVPEIQQPAPTGLATDLIPQLRISKSIGRLTCLRQTPIISDEEEIRKATRYSCVVDTAKNKELSLEDKVIYENLEINEEEQKPFAMDAGANALDVRSFVKTAGRFYCEKRIKMPSGDVRYHCDVRVVAQHISE